MPHQLHYYNAYNRRIRDQVGPLLKTERALKWMNMKTQPVEFTFQISGSGAVSAVGASLTAALVLAARRLSQ